MKALYDYIMENEFGKGLIKIPTDLYKSMLSYIYRQYVSYVWKFNKEKGNELANIYKVNVDKNFEPTNNFIELNTTLENLPQKLKDNWKLEFGYLRLIIDWQQQIWGSRPKVNASYEESNEHGIPGYFTINPRKLMELVANDADISEYKEIFSKLTSTLYHEISHAVQHNCLKWMDKSQVGKSRVVRDNPESSKEARRVEYLSAYVEFDPTIKTKILKFQKEYKGKDLLKSLPVFVGAVKVPGEKPDEFFRVLRDTDMKKWKRAVKKLYMNYDLDIEHILDTLPDK